MQTKISKELISDLIYSNIEGIIYELELYKRSFRDSLQGCVKEKNYIGLLTPIVHLRQDINDALKKHTLATRILLPEFDRLIKGDKFSKNPIEHSNQLTLEKKNSNKKGVGYKRRSKEISENVFFNEQTNHFGAIDTDSSLEITTAERRKRTIISEEVDEFSLENNESFIFQTSEEINRHKRTQSFNKKGRKKDKLKNDIATAQSDFKRENEKDYKVRTDTPGKIEMLDTKLCQVLNKDRVKRLKHIKKSKVIVINEQLNSTLFFGSKFILHRQITKNNEERWHYLLCKKWFKSFSQGVVLRSIQDAIYISPNLFLVDRTGTVYCSSSSSPFKAIYTPASPLQLPPSKKCFISTPTSLFISLLSPILLQVPLSLSAVADALEPSPSFTLAAREEDALPVQSLYYSAGSSTLECLFEDGRIATVDLRSGEVFAQVVADKRVRWKWVGEWKHRCVLVGQDSGAYKVLEISRDTSQGIPTSATPWKRVREFQLEMGKEEADIGGVCWEKEGREEGGKEDILVILPEDGGIQWTGYQENQDGELNKMSLSKKRKLFWLYWLFQQAEATSYVIKNVKVIAN